jgi:hypothetical protein
VSENLRYIEFLQDVLISVHGNLRELNERKTFAAPEEIAHIEGKIMAYREMLSIMKTSAETFKLPTDEIGF